MVWLAPTNNPLNTAIELAWKKRLDADEPAYSMGLGWFIARDGDARFHGGQTGGSRSLVYVNRKLGIALVVLANTSSPDIKAIGKAVVSILTGKTPAEPKPVYSIEVSQQEKRRLVGRYQIRPGFIVEIRLNRGWLIAQATNQRAFRIYPQSPLRWERQDLGLQATFELSENGRASGFTLFQGGQELNAQRLH